MSRQSVFSVRPAAEAARLGNRVVKLGLRSDHLGWSIQAMERSFKSAHISNLMAKQHSFSL
jgi:hypothetical protein